MKQHIFFFTLLNMLGRVNQYQVYFGTSWVEAMGVFTEVTKLDEAIGLETMLWSHWEDLRQISVSIILMPHDLSQLIIIGSETNRQADRRVIYWSPTFRRSVELENRFFVESTKMNTAYILFVWFWFFFRKYLQQMPFLWKEEFYQEV